MEVKMKYKKEKGEIVGYRLYNAKDESIGYIREKELKNLIELSNNKSLAMLYIRKEENADLDIEHEVAKWTVENKDDDLILEEIF